MDWPTWRSKGEHVDCSLGLAYMEIYNRTYRLGLVYMEIQKRTRRLGLTYGELERSVVNMAPPT